jgi:hypothetical protein
MSCRRYVYEGAKRVIQHPRLHTNDLHPIFPHIILLPIFVSPKIKIKAHEPALEHPWRAVIVISSAAFQVHHASFRQRRQVCQQICELDRSEVIQLPMKTPKPQQCSFIHHKFQQNNSKIPRGLMNFQMRHDNIGSTNDEFHPASHLIHKDMEKKIAGSSSCKTSLPTQISSCLRPSQTFFPWGPAVAR